MVSPEERNLSTINRFNKGMKLVKVLQTPVVSGNVSLYNETRGTSIFPTPVMRYGWSY